MYARPLPATPPGRGSPAAPALAIPALAVPVLAVLVLAVLCGGCSSSTSPAGEDLNRLDPGTGTVALKDVTVPGPDGQQVLLRLEGTGLVMDAAAGTVALEVRVRNLSAREVRPPLLVWISDLSPAAVAPLDADLHRPDDVADSTGIVSGPESWGFDYSGLLGGAPIAPGEASPARTWTFTDPTLAPFGFAARVETGVFAGQARVGGRLFADLDRDGKPGRLEPPFTAAGVQVTGPDGSLTWATPAPDGSWEAAVTAPGLHELLFVPLTMGPVPPALTTPNPLSAVVTSGPDGALQDWLEGHFGVADAPGPVPAGTIGFTRLPPDSLHVAPWTLLGASAPPGILSLSVGYSGCRPEHDFSLWMSGGFMESMPPRANVTLVHESQEMCLAWFTSDIAFDLRPLLRLYAAQYGSGPLVLVLHGPDGVVREVALTVPSAP